MCNSEARCPSCLRLTARIPIDRFRSNQIPAVGIGLKDAFEGPLFGDPTQLHAHFACHGELVDADASCDAGSDLGPYASKSHIANRNSSRLARSSVGQSVCLKGSGGEAAKLGKVLSMARVSIPTFSAASGLIKNPSVVPTATPARNRRSRINNHYPSGTGRSRP